MIKTFNIAVLVLLLFIMAVGQSETPSPKVVFPGIPKTEKQIIVDSVRIWTRTIDQYSKATDINNLYTESRIRTYVKRILAKSTASDTSKAKIVITDGKP